MLSDLLSPRETIIFRMLCTKPATVAELHAEVYGPCQSSDTAPSKDDMQRRLGSAMTRIRRKLAGAYELTCTNGTYTLTPCPGS